MKKIIGLFLCTLMFAQILPITEVTGIINTSKEDINENQGVSKYCFTGLFAGRISDVDRFSNKDYITCQAVSVYYDGIVIIRPPHTIDELKGWLYTSEVKICRPYIGIITQNFIFAWVNADKEVFYIHGNNLPLKNDISLIESIAFTPHTNTNDNKAPANNKFSKIVIEICGIDETKKQILQMSKQDAIQLEVLFDDMKHRLDNANTKQETVAIFNEAVLSLKEFSLLPRDMSVEEVLQLVINDNNDINTMKDDEPGKKVLDYNEENFNCLVVGKTSYAEFFKPGWLIFLTRIKIIKTLVNGIISFGDEHWEWGGGSGDFFRNPSSGWVWTNGVNGVKTWEGDSLWGNLGDYYYTYGSPPAFWYEYLFYKGATGFTGIRIRGLENAKFFGYASHVAITTEFPGKSQLKENQKKHASPYLYDKFIFGKVSNVRSGGYTPAYWFHIDKVMIIGKNQISKVQWIEDCKCHILSMNFRGFIFGSKTIIGFVSELFIYD